MTTLCERVVGLRRAFAARCHLFVVALHKNAVDGFNVWCGEAFQRNFINYVAPIVVVSSLIYSLILMSGVLRVALFSIRGCVA